MFINLIYFSPLFLILSLSNLIKAIKMYSAVPIFKYIFGSLIGIFILCLNFLIIIIFGNSIQNIALIHRLALLGGHFGILLWFMGMELLEFENHSIVNFMGYKILMLLTVISMVYNLLTIKYIFNGGWQIIYTLLGKILLPVVYGSFFICQFYLFTAQSIRKQLSKPEEKFPKKMIILYFISCFLLVISFIIGSSYPTIIHPFFWTFFASLSQLAFSIIILKIPTLVFTHEEPIYCAIMTDQGACLYSKKFSEGVDINDQLLAGYLAALNIISNKILLNGTKIVRKIKFDDFYLLIQSTKYLKYCYIFKGSSYFSQQKLMNFFDEININVDLKSHLENCLIEGTKVSERNQNILDKIVELHICLSN